MTTQLRFFQVPVMDSGAAEQELNAFLAGHRIVSIDRHLAQDGGRAVWALCVAYETAGESRPATDKRGRVDYREVLNDADFTTYARLRALRKELAERDGVPVYAVFSNEQMAEMVTRRVGGTADLLQLTGVGKSKVEKYGAAFVAAMSEAADRPESERPGET